MPHFFDTHEITSLNSTTVLAKKKNKEKKHNFLFSRKELTERME